MARKSFTDKNFLAILAFGVMVMAVFLATSLASTPTQSVSKASGWTGGY